MRLPTEVEWVYAARGATPFREIDGKRIPMSFPWGTTPPPQTEAASHGLFKPSPGLITAPVRTYPRGRSVPFGLYDMAGNVAEWTTSSFLPYENPPSGGDGDYDPLRKVVRGSSFFANGRINDARSSVRRYCRESERPEHVGFRCVKPAPEAPPAVR
jgi:formylglycine-generating enzyme required for sulfatase activity